MIVQGTPRMIPALSRIWEACFGDSPEYIRFFMEKRFPTCRCFVWLDKAEPVGAAYLLPCALGARPAYYGYAIGVHPSVRRRGICAELLKCAERFCRQQGAAFFLMPRPGIEDYYLKRGFRSAFYSVTRRIRPSRTADGELELMDVCPAEYIALRDRFFQGPGYVAWDLESVAYALEEQRLCGGFAHVLHWQGERYLLFGRTEGQVLQLRESTLPPDLAEELSPRLCGCYGTSELSVEYPASSAGEGVPRGCCCRDTLPTPGWLALDLT